MFTSTWTFIIPCSTFDLKMHEDSFNLTAPRENVEYVAALSFCCPVKPEKAEAEYESGLLRVEIPFKDPMEDAIKVQVG